MLTKGRRAVNVRFCVAAGGPVCHIFRMRNVFRLGLLIALLAGPGRGAEILDGVIAYVNDRVVTVGEVRRAITMRRRELMKMYEGPELDKQVNKIYAEALNLLVERALILTEFDRMQDQNKLQIPTEAIEGRVDELIERSVGMDRTSLMDALVKDGMNLEELRRPYRERVIIAILRNMEVDSKARVSPGRVRDVYAERAKEYSRVARIHLLMMEWNGAGEDAARVRAKARDVRDRVLDGESFEDLARKHSEGSYRAKGGDRGWIEIDDLRQELKDGIVGLADGEVGRLLEVGDRVYLAKVVARRSAGVRPLSAVYEEIAEGLHAEATRDLYAAWIDRLKQKSYLRIVSDVITEADMPAPRAATSD